MLAARNHENAGRAAIRTACALVDHAPTEAQKEAGNYRKEHVSIQGLPIAIENKRGSVRSGIGPTGRHWSCVLPADYGYIKGTEGADGDHLDCYIGPDPTSRQVFIINQIDHKTGRFDEHKAMIGWHSEADAVRDYCKAFSDDNGRNRIGSVETVSMHSFKHWLATHKTTRPAKSSNIIDHALKAARR
jgi:hypothetical protein